MKYILATLLSIGGGHFFQILGAPPVVFIPISVGYMIWVLEWPVWKGKENCN